MSNFSEHVSLIWSIAELLRGNYKQSEYGKVVLPFTVLRRLDSVLEATKEAVLEKADSMPDGIDSAMAEVMLNQASGNNFHNTSRYTFQKLLDDPENIAANLNNIINSFNEDAREIFVDKFELPIQISRLDKDNLLYLVVQKFAQADLHPDNVDNTAMGYIFEELIRRFSEQSNETAGEHFTPREVIRLMVNLLFAEDGEALTQKGVIRKLYDPACGTGGMLSEAEKYLKELNEHAHLEVYGQELNGESFGICKSDMMIKGQNSKNIKYGNSFSEDGLPNERFDYMLSNPPFGVEWKKVENYVKDEAADLGYSGRFGAGLPRISDGSLLFLQHMMSKMNLSREEGQPPSRIAVVFNGSPLFTGAAGSGESEVRRWIIENDWLEAVVALPTDMFYNTGIATYIWIVTNGKSAERLGKVQLIDAADMYEPLQKNLGSKRRTITEQQIASITEWFAEFRTTERVKWFPNSQFGYHRVTVERPLKLNFSLDEDRIERLEDAKSFAKLTTEKQGEILGALKTIKDKNFSNRDKFVTVLKKKFKDKKLDVKGALLKTIWQSLSSRDENADLCLDGNGNVEPDPDLRDYENVPLQDEVDAYIQREVLPYAAEAWVDHEKTKVGYEIPFNRHFYKFVPPRPLEEIDDELEKVSVDILNLLKDGHS